jgi:hypothetical protein
VEAEVSLTQEPQKADLLLIRRRSARLDEARVLRRLWRMLSTHTLMEFKSISRPPRSGDLVRLLGYAAQYHGPRFGKIGGAENLSLVMVTACMSRVLRRDAERMHWTIDDLQGGYHAVRGTPYPTFLVLLDDVSQSEADRLLGAFGHGTLGDDREAGWWMLAHRTNTAEVNMADLEGWEDFMKKLRQTIPAEVLASLLYPEERIAGLKPEERVAGLKPEERVAGLKPEERRAGLTPDETVLVLADEILRILPEPFIESLPAPVRDEVRRRLRSAH